MLPKKVKEIIAGLQEANFEFDFYIEPHKHRQIKQFTINEFEDVSVEIKAEIDYVNGEYEGGDWDEIITDYTETSRQITVLHVSDAEGDQIEISDKEKAHLEDYLTKQLDFKLY